MTQADLSEKSTFMPYKLVLIEWFDSYGCSSSWVRITEDMHPTPLICCSVGWLVYEDEKCLTVIPHLTEANHENAARQGCGDMTIPRAAVHSIKELKQPKVTS